jgi:hypothetical protein
MIIFFVILIYLFLSFWCAAIFGRKDLEIGLFVVFAALTPIFHLYVVCKYGKVTIIEDFKKLIRELEEN